MRSAFAKNMPKDINLSKAQISKTIQSHGFLCGMLGRLDSVGKTLGKRCSWKWEHWFNFNWCP